MLKVIFTSPVKGVASRGEVKNVREGFFRNFLMPRKLAIPATANLIAQWAAKREKILIEKNELISNLKEMQKRLAGATVMIEKKVTSKGTLYGGVKEADILNAIKEQLKLEFPEGSIVIKSPLKTTGTHDITIDLGDGVTTQLTIEIREKK